MSSDLPETSENLSNCISCRVVCGTTLLASAAYVIYNRKYAKHPASKFVVTVFAIGVAGLGVAQLGNRSLFRREI